MKNTSTSLSNYLFNIVILAIMTIILTMLNSTKLFAQTTSIDSKISKPLGKSAKDIQLNLQNADLRAFIETVAKITEKNMVIDSKVSGTVTLISPSNLDKKQLYSIFKTVLEVRGYKAISTSDNIIKIVPINTNEKNAYIGYDGITQVYQLSHINANQAVTSLTPLIPQGATISADLNTNLVIISGSSSDVERAIDVLARIDQASNNTIEVVRLSNASSIDIVRTINEMIDPSQKVTTKVVADERTNSVMISAPKSEKLRLRTLIAHLDTPIERAGNTEVIYLKYSKATEVEKVLNGTKIIDSTTTGAKPRGNSNYLNDSDISIKADDSTNSLIITAPMATMRNMKQVISKLDIRRAQVLVEAIIAEVSLADAKNVGVQWYGSGGNGTIPVGLINFDNAGSSLLGLGGAYANYLTDGTISTNAVGSGATFGIGNKNLGVVLNALQENTNSNILSTPSILVMDNEEAEMTVGENIPYVTGSFTTTADGSNNPFQTIERQDVGIKLNVKPQINEGGAVTLTIYQEVSNVLSSQFQQQQGPTTAKRALRTTVSVDDNQVLVLGGLIDNQQDDNNQKVPLLGDLPVVGNLFRSKKTSTNKRNLMVFLRPRIIRSARAGNFATQQKYDLIRREQLKSPLKDGNNDNVLPELSNHNFGSDDLSAAYVKNNSDSNSVNNVKIEWQSPAPIYDRSRPVEGNIVYEKTQPKSASMYNSNSNSKR